MFSNFFANFMDAGDANAGSGAGSSGGRETSSSTTPLASAPDGSINSGGGGAGGAPTVVDLNAAPRPGELPVNLIEQTYPAGPVEDPNALRQEGFSLWRERARTVLFLCFCTYYFLLGIQFKSFYFGADWMRKRYSVWYVTYIMECLLYVCVASWALLLHYMDMHTPVPGQGPGSEVFP